ncbi:Do family serine endopeptidase [Psychromonas sp. 14N.309.X.WAT.B.A12]|uniref:Do family serine endopeptidase n=1 Tax=Psychromonas sp. 14N.309.X.WAT.B.A12 TaxID=2998322 RepID=UPI0025B2373B|nr:Do family serine endopeptidase [Psychromonas sp. 14N.309.X.WAT.B.A12]MDN2662946.1 Do family serine endopeptidase [Psychromonas sp. 14N.309.X.WAT.B.A12]
MNMPLRFILLIIMLCTSTFNYAALPLTVDGNNVPSLAPLIKKVSPAVVDISVSGASKILTKDAQDLLKFLEPNAPTQPFSGLGSGVIVDAEQGYIITNYHVIKNANSILIKLISGHQYQAKVVGQDIQSDIALLQIDSKQPLVAMTFANSDKLQVGDFTIAIGNPFGLGQTVTSGIVSALGRSGLNLQNLENYIQTDAAINSGNSGGALINLKGELIGINTAILGPNGGNIGIAFAIPANMVKNLMQQLLEFGEIRRGILGIKGGEVTPDLAQSIGLDVNYGAFIYQVTPDSAADKAGLKAGDVITAINGANIKSFAALRAKIGSLSAGKEISLKVIQKDEVKTLTVILGGEGDNLQAKAPAIIFEGATLKDADEGQVTAGVNVVNVEKASEAERLGLLKDDVIIAVNRTQVKNQQQLIEALADSKMVTALNIMRNNRPIYIIIN